MFSASDESYSHHCHCSCRSLPLTDGIVWRSTAGQAYHYGTSKESSVIKRHATSAYTATS